MPHSRTSCFFLGVAGKTRKQAPFPCSFPCFRCPFRCPFPVPCHEDRSGTRRKKRRTPLLPAQTCFIRGHNRRRMPARANGGHAPDDGEGACTCPEAPAFRDQALKTGLVACREARIRRSGKTRIPPPKDSLPKTPRSRGSPLFRPPPGPGHPPRIPARIFFFRGNAHRQNKARHDEARTFARSWSLTHAPDGREHGF